MRLARTIAATDSGQAVNPNGIRNQTVGGIIRAASWTLFDAVGFSPAEITARDWNSYLFLCFDAVRDVIEVNVIDQPGAPLLGAGEAAQGPTAAAIANAIADTTGVRLRPAVHAEARQSRNRGVGRNRRTAASAPSNTDAARQNAVTPALPAG